MGILGGGAESQSESQIENKWENMTAQIQDTADLLSHSKGATVGRDEAITFGKSASNNLMALGSNSMTLSGSKVGGDIYASDHGSIMGAFDFASKALDSVTGSVDKAYNYMDNAAGQFTDVVMAAETQKDLGLPVSPKMLLVLGIAAIGGITFIMRK